MLYKVNGCDESFVGYGMEDVDLINRMEMLGGKRYFIENPEYLKAIGHQMIERVKNFRLYNELSKLCVLYSKSDKYLCNAFYFFNDHKFFEIKYERYVDTKDFNVMIENYGWRLVIDSYKLGNYSIAKNEIQLKYNDPDGDRKDIKIDMDDFIEIEKKDPVYVYWILMYSECYNRYIYSLNDKNRISVANAKTGWGKGEVILNWNKKITLY